MANVPEKKPQLTQSDALDIIKKNDPEKQLSPYRVILLAVRGYYKTTMGNPLKNDRGIYDDAIFVITPTSFRSFNANTDPSVMRKGISVLKAGLHFFKKGHHGISKPGGGYPAFRPATADESLPVTRDGVGESRGVAINIHKGGFNTTSSEGCQTIYPTQWTEFQTLVYDLMTKYRQKEIPYLLVEF